MLHHLNQRDLARRWGLSPRTLERWRWTGEGPAFLKGDGRSFAEIAAERTHKPDASAA